MKNIKYSLIILFLSLSLISCAKRQMVKIRQMFLSTKVSIDVSSKIYLAYYEFQWQSALDELKDNKISKDEYLAKKQKLTDLESRIMPLFKKASELQNAAVDIIFAVDNNIKDFKTGNIELNKINGDLTNILIQINSILNEFGIR